MENTILEVTVEKGETQGVIGVAFHEAIVERLGTKKMEEYSEEILEILERISKDI